MSDLLGFIDSHLKLSVAAFLLAYIAAYIFYQLVLRYNFTSTYRNLPGPRRSSYLFGNVGDLFETSPQFLAFDQWRSKYGGFVRFGGFNGTDAILVSDPAALKHMLLDQSYSYPKPKDARDTLRMLAGDGILVAEGDMHRRQKRLLGPAFSQPHTTSLTPLFIGKAQQLSDIWAKMLAGKQKTNVDAVDWMGRLTLDMISIAGFGYEMDSLYSNDNPLAEGFRSLFSAEPAPNHVSIYFRRLLLRVPLIGRLPVPRLVAIRASMKTMQEESHKIIAARKADLAQESFRGKDLISVLLRANAQADEKTKLSEEEVRAQITTFLIAGSETTSTAASWTLYYLSRHQNIQDKLREEVQSLPKSEDGSFTAEAVINAPYLDAVVREISRIVPSVSATEREAAVDDIIPLSTPITLRDGTQTSSVHIKAGTHFQIAIAELNRRPDLWGTDVGVFRPERWLEPLPAHLSSQTQGYCAYSHELTFIGGPRACIGRFFAIAELKSILAVLIARFRIDEHPDRPEIIQRTDITNGAYVKGDEIFGKQLPLQISLA